MKMTRPTRSAARSVVGLALLGAALVAAAPQPAAAQKLAFEEVVANMKVGDPKVRMDALRLLREAGYLEAAPLVAPLLSDPVPEIQALAIETEVALYLVDEAYTRQYGKTLVKAKGASLPLLAFAQGRGATIANLPSAAILRGLQAAAASPVATVRFDAAYAIGVLGAPLVRRGQFPDARATVDRLMVLLREPDATMRLAATHVLGRLMGSALANPSANADLLALKADVGDQIIAGMNDPDEMIRLSSMGALGEMRHDRAVQALSDSFSYYKRNRLGMAALDALAQIAHTGTMTVFAALLENGDEHVRRLSAEGIGRSGDAGALANLGVRTTREKSKLVLQAVAFARAKGGDFSEITRVVDGLRNTVLRPYAYDYLVELGSPLAPSLAGLASHKDAAVRAGVVDILGIIGNEATLTAIDGYSRDKNKNVAAAAERSRRRLAVRLPAQPRVP
jgi:HEAT repeat protein